jgi:hypothetical protein
MDRIERAKQFMPFDALNGFYKAIRVKEDINDDYIFLAEDEKERLNRLLTGIIPGDDIEIKYYLKGKYIKIRGIIKKTDSTKGLICFEDDTNIKIKNIVDIKTFD